jgi:hypothetical protein
MDNDHQMNDDHQVDIDYPMNDRQGENDMEKYEFLPESIFMAQAADDLFSLFSF